MADGQQLYLRCAGCHSTGGGTPMLPNLGRVKEIGKDGFKAIVLQGALLPLGMPVFEGDLTEAQTDALYEYVARGLHNRPIAESWY
jgi:mono/diheme cytochrome c family protein